jgi:hypothetical protein
MRLGEERIHPVTQGARPVWSGPLSRQESLGKEEEM